MKLYTSILVSIIASESQHPFARAAEQVGDVQGGLRGNNSEGRKLAGNLFGGNNGNGNGSQGKDKDGKGPKRELSGRVIISRKTEKKLKKEGKKPNEIAAIRSQGLSEIFEKNKVVFESSGEGDFQVVEVGVGNEDSFIKSLWNGPKKDLFEYVEPDYIEYPIATPNDPNLGLQYHHDNMQSYAAWDMSTGSDTVTVGICDTGLQLDHPDLADNRLEGYQATTQLWESEGGDVSPVHPHGTMCAGCAAAIGNNGQGLAGVGWNLKHRPGRVSDSSSGSASSSVIADCARKMCELPDVKVASVSYSGPEGSARLSAAAYCKSQGALLVNSAGNDNRDLTQFGNADADDLIVVGASDNSDSKASFSAYGQYVDVWAPGVDVWTTTTGSGYSAVSGTSFSCPLTAGLIALIWSMKPELTPDEVEAVLKQSTDDVGLQGQWNTAWGRINSFKALQLAGSGTPFPTSAPTTSPPTVAPEPTEPTIEASYDAASGAPRCTEIGGACSSGVLLDSRGLMNPSAEPNHSNAIDSCLDGDSGSYHSDESNDAIEVAAVNGGFLKVGRTAVLKATVWAWSTGQSDTADFYVTEGNSNPVWVHIGSVKPAGGGSQIIESDPFELTSTLQTVRVRFRYGGYEDPCSNGSFDDVDDLVFAVAPSGPVVPPPTDAPVTATPTTSPSPTVNCVDDPDWGVTVFNGNFKGCMWVAKNANVRCEEIGDDGTPAVLGCPASCNAACPSDPVVPPPTDAPVTATPTTSPSPIVNCVDDRDWGVTVFNGNFKGCTWVANNVNVRCEEIGDDGTPAVLGCPASCNAACQ